jgi:hypothetical protein
MIVSGSVVGGGTPPGHQPIPRHQSLGRCLHHGLCGRRIAALQRPDDRLMSRGHTAEPLRANEDGEAPTPRLGLEL